MSASIVKIGSAEHPTKMFYAKEKSCPADLGFALLALSKTDDAKQSDLSKLSCLKDYCMSEVTEIPRDIQYEYVLSDDPKTSVHCQECWYTSDKNYHGGGFRHGGTYDLEQWKEKIRLQSLYSYRRPEAWQ